VLAALATESEQQMEDLICRGRDQPVEQWMNFLRTPFPSGGSGL
jgi:hypothetical protein